MLRNEKADWVKILNVMYEHQMVHEISEEDNLNGLGAALGSSIVIANETDSLGDELHDTLQFLEKLGFIEYDSGPISLTQEGLQLAHQIKTERQRRNTNIILVALTAVLTILTIGLFVVEILPLL